MSVIKKMSEEEPKWFSGYIKTHDQDHQQLERKIEGLENHYNIKTLTNTINMLIDNNVKIRELEQKLSNFGETLGSQMGINLKALNKYKMLEQSIKEIKEISLRAITDNINEWVDNYTEFKSIILNFLDNSASYHARQNNSEWALEIRKFIKRLKEIKTKKKEPKKHYIIDLSPKFTHAIKTSGLITIEHHKEILAEVKQRQKDKFIEDLNALEKKFPIDNSRGEVLEVEAVSYSDIEKLIKKLEEDLETTVSGTNSNQNKEGN